MDLEQMTGGRKRRVTVQLTGDQAADHQQREADEA